MSFLGFRYVLAQAVILVLWAQDWRSGVAGIYPDRILLPEALIVSFLGMPAALAVGVVDGSVGGWRRNARERAGVAVLVTLLVLLLAAWITAAGLLSIYVNLASSTQEPPVMVRVFVLFVVELVFAVEVITAYLTSRYLSGPDREHTGR